MKIVLLLPAQAEAELIEAAREEGKTPGVLAAKVLDDYLFIRKYRRLRQSMFRQASRVYTDEEIFELCESRH